MTTREYADTLRDLLERLQEHEDTERCVQEILSLRRLELREVLDETNRDLSDVSAHISDLHGKLFDVETRLLRLQLEVNR